MLWEADGVLFGHFLSATSEDAVVNCLGCEGHPALFGGTLLLTKEAGEWKPETAAQARERIAEVIELADHDILDIARSRAAEQEVLDLLDEPPTR